MKVEKNILMVGTSLTTKGGMTTVVEDYLNHSWSNCNIYFIPTHIEKNIIIQLFYFFIAVLRILLKLIFNEIDIVHIHISERGSFIRKKIIVFLSKLFNKKVIIHMHGAEFKDFYLTSSKYIQSRITKMLEDADAVLVLGNSWFDFVKEISSEIKIHIFRNSVKIPERVAHFDKSDTFNVLFLAVLIRRKGIYDLVYAVEEIVKQGYTSIKFIIAGCGEEEQNIKALIREKGLNDYFTFKGWVSGKKKDNLIMSSQAFILPSYNEGLPVGILEAMSYGVPVIATRVGSVGDVIKNNMNGYLVEQGDVVGISRAIIDCFNNPDKWRIYSENSRKIIYKDYNQSQYFKRIESLYNRL